MSTFRVGQKIVCISNMANTISDGSEPNGHLVYKDEIYTIARIEWDEEGQWLILVEVPGWAFESQDFRPLELDYDFVEDVISQVTPKEELV